MTKVVIVRLDSVGDVLLAGPAIRAVALSGAEVTLLCSSVGKSAADLLPGVADTLTFDAPWVHVPPPPARAAEVARLVWKLRRFDEAIILTSRFQNSIATALLLRLAGVKRITGISDDYPGSLLDERVGVPDEAHEVQRNLAITAAAGYPGGDALQLVDLPHIAQPTGPYVVVHPGADAESRAIDPELAARVVEVLAERGYTPVVTGAPSEAPLTSRVAGRRGRDLGGRTTLAELAALLHGAKAVVVGNTGPAHLAASVGTPVVSLFPPVVPWQKWSPYGVPVVRLGDQASACADTRARECPVPGHPCMSGVQAEDVADAVEQLVGVAA